MNSKHLKGLAVISIADGEKLGTIDRVLVDPAAAKVVGFTVRHGAGGLIPIPTDSADEDVIDVDDIHALGKDAVTLNDKGAVRGDQTRARIDSLMDHDQFAKLKVVTEGGTYVGDFVSAEIDERGFGLKELEVSPGFFSSNRHVPMSQVINIGHELIVVSDEVCADAATDDDDAIRAEGGERRLVVGDT